MAMYIVFFLALIFVVVLFLVIVKTVPNFCQHCHKKTTIFSKLPEEEQEKIKQYYIKNEEREVDESGVFVCTHCKFVHDDFSGEKHSRDTDHGYEMAANGKVFKHSHWKSICKVCGLLVFACDPKNPEIKCASCETGYHWVYDSETGYYYFRIIGNKKVTGIPSHFFGLA